MSSLKTIFDSAYADLLKEVTPLDAADNLYPRPRNWGLYQFLPPNREEDEVADSVSAVATKKPFDISPLTSGAVLKLAIYLSETYYSTAVRGVPKNVAAGTGWAFDANTNLFSVTLSAGSIVYLKYSRASATVTLEFATGNALATFINLDDYAYRPLWYIAWVGGAIDVTNSVDLRESYIVDGIS